MRPTTWTTTFGLTACLAAAPMIPSAAAAAVPLGAFGTAVPAAHQAAADDRLRHDQRGDDVRQWQAVLNRAIAAGVLAHARLVEDGVFGPNTTGATLALQRTLGIDRDGVVGPITRDGIGGLIDGATGPGEAGPDRLLRFGMRGDDVRSWQQGINQVVAANRPAYPAVAEDGIFGKDTRSATSQVQRILGVSPDAIVGPITRDGVAGLLDG